MKAKNLLLLPFFSLSSSNVIEMEKPEFQKPLISDYETSNNIIQSSKLLQADQEDQIDKILNLQNNKFKRIPVASNPVILEADSSLQNLINQQKQGSSNSKQQQIIFNDINLSEDDKKLIRNKNYKNLEYKILDTIIDMVEQNQQAQENLDQVEQISIKTQKNETVIDTEFDPNIKINDCEHIILNEALQPAKKVAVTSFPGSGNTWMRHLLHMATGYHTGSIYHDGKLKEKGFLGETLEWDDPRVVGIKLHKYGYLKKLAIDSEVEDKSLIEKAVLLIRSPYRALMSEFNRVNNEHHLHVGKADLTAFSDGTWDTFLSTNIEKWQTSITSWIESYSGEVQVVCYEDLKDNTHDNLENILKFIDLFLCDTFSYLNFLLR